MDEIDLTITREFVAPPEQVFALWAEAKHRLRWWAPKGLHCTEFEHDFREGGAWQSRFVGNDSGKSFWMGGTYREIDAPWKLVFAFSWLEDGVTPGHPYLITVTLTPAEGGTRQTFNQAAFTKVVARDQHEVGWGEVFDRMAKALTA